MRCDVIMNEQNKQMLPIIVGPTACGKTAVSIEVAKQLQAEIISADSVQIYEKIDIGSAKPTEDEMQGIRHHMIGVVPLTCTDFSAANYQTQADQIIVDIGQKEKKALVVGGTGFYVRTLTDVLDFAKTNKDENFRAAWRKREEEEPGSTYRALQAVDPIRAEQLHYNDENRIIRALEVYHLTGKPMSEQKQDQTREEGKYSVAMVGLTMPREQLYERINKRVELMFQQGLIEEVENILLEGYQTDLPALQSIGYKETIAYLKGEITKQEAMEQIQLATRHYAKRQWTWFRRDERVFWIDVSLYSKQELTNKIVNYYEEQYFQ